LIQLNSDPDNKIFNINYQTRILEIIENNLLSFDDQEHYKSLLNSEKDLKKVKLNASEITNSIQITHPNDSKNESKSNVDENLAKNIPFKTSKLSTNTKAVQNVKKKKLFLSAYNNVNTNTNTNNNTNTTNTLPNKPKPDHQKTNKNNNTFTTIPNNYINFDQKFNQDDFKILGNGFSIINSKSSRSKKIITFKEIHIQTDFNLQDLDKILALNDEFSQQLSEYQQQFDILEKNYNKKLSELEGKKSSEIEYIPEMIPPEETYKIFNCIINYLIVFRLLEKYKRRRNK